MRNLQTDENGMPKNPLYWAYAAGGTNEAWARLSRYCLDEWNYLGVNFECCELKGHEGKHAGYGLDENGVERYAEWWEWRGENGAETGA